VIRLLQDAPADRFQDEYSAHTLRLRRCRHWF